MAEWEHLDCSSDVGVLAYIVVLVVFAVVVAEGFAAAVAAASSGHGHIDYYYSAFAWAVAA